jgi:hypothetical protein
MERLSDTDLRNFADDPDGFPDIRAACAELVAAREALSQIASGDLNYGACCNLALKLTERK